MVNKYEKGGNTFYQGDNSKWRSWKAGNSMPLVKSIVYHECSAHRLWIFQEELKALFFGGVVLLVVKLFIIKAKKSF